MIISAFTSIELHNMRFKISDKIITKKEILLYPEGYNQYFLVKKGKKVYDHAKQIEIGDSIDCSSQLSNNSNDLVEDFVVIKSNKK